MKRSAAAVLNEQLIPKADGLHDLGKLTMGLCLLHWMGSHCLDTTSPRRLHVAHSPSMPSGNTLSGRNVAHMRPTTLALAMPTDNVNALRGWDSATNTASALRLHKAAQRAGQKVFGFYFPVLTSRPVRENKKPNAACFSR